LKVETILTIRLNWKITVITIDPELIVIEVVTRILVKKTTFENIKIIVVIKIEFVMIIIVIGMNNIEVEIISIEDVGVEEVDLLSSLIVT
jgi:hypothetical protein